MDDLTGEQYEQVLQYMESVGEEDFSSAAAALHQHDFNMTLAINRRFQAHPRQSPAEGGRQLPEDEQIVRRYIDFSRRKNEEWSVVAVLFDIVKYLLSSISRLLVGLLPVSLATRYFGSPFEKAYFGRIRQHYAHRPLAYYLPKTKNLSSKSVLLLLSPRAEHPDVTALLNNAPLRRKIDQNFFLTCYVVESAELSKVQGSRDAPQLIALRWNIFQELVQVGRERNLKGFSGEQLGRWAHEGRNLFKRDGNVLIKFRNYLARVNGIHYEEEEEEEVSLAQRETERHQIHQQNQAYQQMEEVTRRSKQEEAERRLKAEEEERMREELQEERRVRKMSIPDEPTSGSIIRLSFRCPDGSTLIRNFQSDERVELLFHWVQLNETVEFQDEKRQFQIMYSYPPRPLSSQKDRLLKEVFESQQEKVLIREM